MKSARRGKRTSTVEVGNISRHGFWILLGEVEYFLPFTKFPWFQDAAVGQILNVKLIRVDHLYWPEIDVDLTLQAIVDPDKYPLVSRERPPKKYSSSRKSTSKGKSARGR